MLTSYMYMYTRTLRCEPKYCPNAEGRQLIGKKVLIAYLPLYAVSMQWSI